MTPEQLIGFAQRSADDAWLNSNTHTAEVFTAIAKRLLLVQQVAQEMRDVADAEIEEWSHCVSIEHLMVNLSVKDLLEWVKRLEAGK